MQKWQQWEMAGEAAWGVALHEEALIRSLTCSGVSRQPSSTQPGANRSMWRPLPATLSAI